MSFQEWWRKMYQDKKKKQPVIIQPGIVVPDREIKEDKGDKK